MPFQQPKFNANLIMISTAVAAAFFWSLIFLVFYTYVGYGILLFFLVKFKKKKEMPAYKDDKDLPEVTFMVAAYNEQDYMEEKIENCLNFNYPKDKITLFFVTDGSDDDTPKVIDHYPLPDGAKLELFHSPERKGKIAAVERVMPYVKTPIVIYTDANTRVNKDAIRNIVRHYINPKVGAVAGEKRITMDEKDAAKSAGEGVYWKYESKLKQWDSELYSVVGAAGELFSIRTELFEAVPQDTVIEDFFMTLKIASKGYTVVYEPMAYAVESSSASVKEELKRKIRIAAGGLQAVSRLKFLLNPFKYGTLSFQYISHRVLRWTLAPLALPIILVLNIFLAMTGNPIYMGLLACQFLFYGMGLIGYLLQEKELKSKIFFIPYYFCVMNYAVYRGFFRFINKSQSVKWERAKRAV